MHITEFINQLKNARTDEKIHTLLARLRNDKVEYGWLPIETAPKHTRILTLMKHGVIEGEYDGEFCYGYYYKEMQWGATHWQPLPKRPKEKESVK